MSDYQTIKVVPLEEIAPLIEGFRREIAELRELLGAESDGVEISGVKAAELLGITPQTVSNWLKQGKIGVWRGGRRVVTLGCVKRAKNEKFSAK